MGIFSNRLLLKHHDIQTPPGKVHDASSPDFEITLADDQYSDPSHPIIKPVPQPAIDEPTQQAALTHWLSDHCHSDALLSLRGFALESTPKQRKKKGETKTVPFDQFHATPDAIPGYGMRKAVALDCEMVELKAGRIVVAFLTAIDFFTGEILINHHVQPTERVVRWNTRKSGVTPQSMRNAVNRGEALFGWQNARRRLWDFVDSQTILIGHSLNNDLNVLGIFHRHIVDSSIVTGQAVFQDRNLRRTWALKTLAKELLEYDIQASKAGHSALEDTQATRDILIWCFRYPERLKTWADDNRIKEEERFAEEQRKAEIRRKEREEARKKKEVKEAALQKEDVGLVSAHPPGQQPGPGLQNNPSLGSSPSHTDLENGRNQRRRGRKDHTMIFASAISVRGPSSFL
ncbi:hypothetical protein N7462_002073 [Penicillium macrosclerotiorum]|uniref:uncharacterized protein n=1 Tax=Penicillium macrosclerotiorum TaxID=303699 RepID=UPI002549A7CA|nr:uncharacterized protein N7462_002073 [Penicillium macrosclerotiorum]KAJ5692650.1 hypothetical protein N7462_002073 [Penicillium macrosclerotiorum]